MRASGGGLDFAENEDSDLPGKNSRLTILLRPPWVYLVIWLLCIKVSFWFGANFFIDGWRHFAEAGVYVFLLALLYRHPRVRGLFLGVRQVVRILAIGLAILAISAQLSRNVSTTYPFVPWTMYSSAEPIEWTYIDVIGVRGDGSRVSLTDGEDFPLDFRALLRNVETLNQNRERARSSPIERLEYEKQLLSTLRNWARAHSDRMGKESFPEVVLQRVTVDSDFVPITEKILGVDLTDRIGNGGGKNEAGSSPGTSGAR